jgi:RNA polymerase sigma-70 factor, ECF subfamily
LLAKWPWTNISTTNLLLVMDFERHKLFLKCFTRYEPDIHAFVRSLVQRRDDATEIMQEVAVKLWEKFELFDESRDFRTWACGFARYEVLAFYRDQARDRLVFDIELVGLMADEGIADSQSQQRQEALVDCLEKLKPSDRQLVMNAYASDQHIKAIAAQHGKSATSVYKVLHRLRLTLLDCIQRSLAAGGAS